MTDAASQPRPVRVEPWAFPLDAYERDPDALVVDALLRGAYDSILEVGCGGGELTQRLSGMCVQILATDIAPSSVAKARQRCGHLHNTSIRCSDLTEHLPDGPFDLVVLREAGHHLKPREILALSLALAERLLPGGELIAVHGIADRAQHQLASDSIHNLLSANLPLEWVKGERGVGFRMDSWVKPSGRR